MLEEPTTWIHGASNPARISAKKLIIKEMLHLDATEEETRAGIAKMNLLDNLYGKEKMLHNSSIIEEFDIIDNVNANNNIKTNVLDAAEKHICNNVVVKTNDTILNANIDIISVSNDSIKTDTLDVVEQHMCNDVVVKTNDTIFNNSNANMNNSSDLKINNTVNIYEEIKKTLIFMFFIFLFMGVCAYKICTMNIKMFCFVYKQLKILYRQITEKSFIKDRDK